jgi:hypothetical protein
VNSDYFGRKTLQLIGSQCHFFFVVVLVLQLFKHVAHIYIQILQQPPASSARIRPSATRTANSRSWRATESTRTLPITSSECSFETPKKNPSERERHASRHSEMKRPSSRLIVPRVQQKRGCCFVSGFKQAPFTTRRAGPRRSWRSDVARSLARAPPPVYRG